MIRIVYHVVIHWLHYLNGEKRCIEIPKYAREILKEMMGEQYPKSYEAKDLHVK